MKISLDKLIKREISNLDLNFCEKIDSISYCDTIYKIASPVSLQGTIKTTGKGMFLDCIVKFTIIDQCSRCLEEVEEVIEYPIQGFLVKENVDEDQVEEYDVFYYNEEQYDFLDAIKNTLDFNLPQRVVCDENCKGLCPKCGANLNKETCSCTKEVNDEEIIDPRFAKLKDLFKND